VNLALLRASLSSRKAQLAFYAEIEKLAAERGHPLKIKWFMGRWEIMKGKK
jgi:hypothetical protein